MNNMMVSELQPQSYVMEVEEAARVMRHNFGAPDSIVVDPPYYNYIILYDRPIQQWRAWLASRSYCLNMHCVSSLASISMDGWLVMNTQEVKFLSQMSHVLTQWCTKGRWSPLDIHLASKLEVASNQKISNERQNWGGGVIYIKEEALSIYSSQGVILGIYISALTFKYSEFTKGLAHLSMWGWSRDLSPDLVPGCISMRIVA